MSEEFDEAYGLQSDTMICGCTWTNWTLFWTMANRTYYFSNLLCPCWILSFSACLILHFPCIYQGRKAPIRFMTHPSKTLLPQIKSIYQWSSALSDAQQKHCWWYPTSTYVANQFLKQDTLHSCSIILNSPTRAKSFRWFFLYFVRCFWEMFCSLFPICKTLIFSIYHFQTLLQGLDL